MAIGPGANAGPYPLFPPRYSLLESAAVPRLPDGTVDPEGQLDNVLGQGQYLPRWVGGLHWAPEPYADFTAQAPENTPGATVLPPPNPSQRDLLPIEITVADQSSTLEAASHDFNGRLQRAIRAATPRVIGAEFWTGALHATNPHLNGTAITVGTPPSLTPTAGQGIAGDVTPSGAAAGGASPERVLEELEGWGRGSSFGVDGMIHAEPRLVAAWSQRQMIYTDGKYLRTYQGTIVVADPGYPGTGPDGTGGLMNATAANRSSTWAYFTDVVTVWTSPIILVPDFDPTGGALGSALGTGDGSGLAGSSLSPTVNTVTWSANRVAAAGWDGRRLFAAKALLPL